MAQTKRKRRRKHRGTQAGTIETPGRTGRSRAPAASGSKKTATTRGAGKAARPHRLDKPPTWRGSLNRSVVMAAIVFLFLGLTQKNWAAAALLSVVAVAIYVPITFYTDRAIYRRRQRQKQKG
jgi:phosphatidylglycerophosphate synthase